MVNLEGVGFLDSSALSALIRGRKHAKTGGGELSLVCTRQNTLKVFEITQLDELFAIHDSLDAATSQ